MKLYEFIYNDNTNLSLSELLENVRIFLEEESQIQGWAPGYTFRQCQSPKQLAGGEKEYSFVVEGEIL